MSSNIFRMLLAGLILVFVQIGIAIAAVDNDEGTPTSEQATVTVDVPVIFYLDWQDETPGHHTFTLTEADLAAPEPKSLEVISQGTLEYFSNFDVNELSVSRGAWTSYPSGGDGDFTLATKKPDGTWVVVPPTPYQQLLLTTNGGGGLLPVEYKLTDYGMEDDKGVYMTTLTWVWWHSS